jgi:hypothetical protein
VDVTHVTVKNGMTLAYTLAFVNSALALVEAFGVMLSHAQELGITGFVNATFLLAARVLSMKEATSDGGTVSVAHVPVLVETPPSGGTPTVTQPVLDPAPAVGVTQ